VDSSTGDLLSVHLEISCPSAGSALSAYLEFRVSVVTGHLGDPIPQYLSLLVRVSGTLTNQVGQVFHLGLAAR
jgi:hypothetical protein